MILIDSISMRTQTFDIFQRASECIYLFWADLLPEVEAHGDGQDSCASKGPTSCADTATY